MRAWRLPAATAAILGAAALVSREPVRAQQAGPGELHFGAGSCAAQACHGGGFAERQEYKVWATRDRHAKAYDSLGGDLGRRIGERLGLDPLRAPECLSCHGTTGVVTAATFDPHDGVSCEHCHGGAGRWLGPHAAPGFKDKPPAEKESLGLRDLSSPAKRAAACVGCHVGGEGREVPHTMMAAGHPALAFDLAKFLRDMPPHWKREADPSTWAEGVKAVAAARLRQAARAAEGAKEWPEFAAFDCASCHHAIGAGMDARPGARPGDLPVDLAGLEVLAVGAGDASIARSATYRPGADRRAFAELATRAASDVERIGVANGGLAERLDARLARIEAGEEPATRSFMLHAAFAVFDLAPSSAALAELDAALAKPYDARACAALARRALADR
jgi:hypothetical protein